MIIKKIPEKWKDKARRDITRIENIFIKNTNMKTDKRDKLLRKLKEHHNLLLT